MKYILREDISLCGWDKLPYALKEGRNGNVQLLNKADFELLLRFNGKENIDIAALDERKRRFAEWLLEKGIIAEAACGETCEPPYRFYPNRYKQEAHWSVTGKCNYRCKHCMVSSPSGAMGELTHEQCVDIIRQLSACGVQYVSLTGGEPLVRPDFIDLVDEILNCGMFVSTIYSNGRLISQKLLDALKNRGMNPAFQISFDGIGWHDWMRGVPGAEQTAFDCFRLLTENGFQFSCAMCIFRENIASIRQTVTALADADCTALKLQLSAPEGEWLAQKEHYLTYDEVFQAYLAYIPQFYEDGCPLNLQMEGFFLYDKNTGSYMVPAERVCSERELRFVPPCRVVHNEMYISPKGYILPCMSFAGNALEETMPNITATPLSKILSDSEYTRLLDKRLGYLLEHDSECRECEYRLKCCGGCRAMAMFDNPDDYFARDNVTCRIFRDGWIEKIDAVAGKYGKKRIFSDKERLDLK